MAAKRNAQRPSLATTLAGLDLELGGAIDDRGRHAITRDGKVWFEGTAHQVSALFLAAADMLQALRILGSCDKCGEDYGRCAKCDRLIAGVLERAEVRS